MRVTFLLVAIALLVAGDGGDGGGEAAAETDEAFDPDVCPDLEIDEAETRVAV